LTGASVSDFVSTVLFGQTPVLSIGHLSVFPVQLYGLLLVFGIILGLFGFLYQKFLLFSLNCYSKIRVPKYLYGIVPFILVIPIGILWPNLLGGGNNLILSLKEAPMTMKMIIVILLIRFVFSMISYGSGLPGGIFLPILTLGALSGALMAHIFVYLHLMSANYALKFIVIGMAGYFACIGKAPFTAIILIFEMVGSVTHILPLALVSLVAYLVVDLLNGAPIYESLLERLLKRKPAHLATSSMITMEVTVLAGGMLEDQQIRDLQLESNSLITLVRRSENVLIPKGDLVLRAGDIIYIRMNQKDAKITRNQLSLNN